MGMAVHVFHILIPSNTANFPQTGGIDSSVLEKTVKHLFTLALKLSQVKEDLVSLKTQNVFNTENNFCLSLGLFLCQHIVNELLVSTL